MSFEIRNVSVVGAGVMGHGIAQVFAMNGYQVNLVDISHEILDKAIGKIRWSLDRLAEKGKLKEDISSVISRIKPNVNLLDAVKDADLVIEAVSERIDLKTKVFAEVDSVAPKHCILCSNTSGLPITLMAEATKRPEKVLGMHWFNPPQLMRLIEVVKTKYTTNETANLIYELAKKLGKTPIMVDRDVRDFIANRIYRTIRYEAYLMFLRGEAKPVEIDSTCRYKLKLPMGPFELADFTGAVDLEISADMAIKEILEKCPEWEPQKEFLTFREAALKLAKEYYDKGLLGVKSGEGFYKYPEPGKWVKVDMPEEVAEKVDPLQIVAPAINASAWLIRNNVVTAEDIDNSLKLGYNFPTGLLEFADEKGLDSVVDVLKAKTERVKEPYRAFYKPDNLLLNLLNEGKLGKRNGEGFYKY